MSVGNYLKVNIDSELQTETFLQFVSQLEKIHSCVSQIFKDILDCLAQEGCCLHDKFPQDDGLSIILKIVRYEYEDSELPADVHVDKSALTLILDNDDVENNKLVVSRYKDKLMFKDLRQPQREFDDNPELYTSSILLPGNILQHVGINLNPTPHAVLPFNGSFRHSLIAFLLIPNVDTELIGTKVEYT